MCAMRGSYPILTTDAFILYTRAVGEADRIVTALTRDGGLMQIYARSIRKEGAKMRGSVRPYGKVLLSVILGKRNILKDITVTNTLDSVWSSEIKYTVFVTLLRSVRSFIPVTEESEADVFSIVEDAACFLSEAPPESATDILLVAQVMILVVLGYVPDQHMVSGMFADVVADISSSPDQRRAFTQHLQNALWYQ